jgi:glycosyltransferase involved in cell wall biosynthesis
MKPTILQVRPALESGGGVEIETLDIAKAIVLAGGKALIAAKMGKMAETILPKGIELINLPLKTKNPFQISKNAHLLKDLILKEKVDLVHVRSRAPAWSAYKAARSLGIPFMTTYHAAYSSNTLLKTFYNSVMARGDRVIAISHFIKDHLIKKYTRYAWFDPSKIRLIPRGIDLYYFDPARIPPKDIQRLRENWGISSSMRILLLPGRISRTKGQNLLMKSLSFMKHKNVMLLFMGSAHGHQSYQDTLVRYATSLNLEDRIKWLPPYPDLPTAYQLADIIVSPSLVPEGFGRVVAEAQAMQKPIIACDHGAPQEIIADGITGWLTPPGNAKALAQALDDALDLPPERLEEMGEQGRARVQAHFFKEAMFSQTIAVYQELLEGAI